jgi:hypothetical protein
MSEDPRLCASESKDLRLRLFLLLLFLLVIPEGDLLLLLPLLLSLSVFACHSEPKAKNPRISPEVPQLHRKRNRLHL